MESWDGLLGQDAPKLSCNLFLHNVWCHLNDCMGLIIVMGNWGAFYLSAYPYSLCRGRCVTVFICKSKIVSILAILNDCSLIISYRSSSRLGFVHERGKFFILRARGRMMESSVVHCWLLHAADQGKAFVSRTEIQTVWLLKLCFSATRMRRALASGNGTTFFLCL